MLVGGEEDRAENSSRAWEREGEILRRLTAGFNWIDEDRITSMFFKFSSVRCSAWFVILRPVLRLRWSDLQIGFGEMMFYTKFVWRWCENSLERLLVTVTLRGSFWFDVLVLTFTTSCRCQVTCMFKQRTVTTYLNTIWHYAGNTLNRSWVDKFGDY